MSPVLVVARPMYNYYTQPKIRIRSGAEFNAESDSSTDYSFNVGQFSGLS
jgi:hypothetical protein